MKFLLLFPEDNDFFSLIFSALIKMESYTFLRCNCFTSRNAWMRHTLHKKIKINTMILNFLWIKNALRVYIFDMQGEKGKILAMAM